MYDFDVKIKGYYISKLKCKVKTLCPIAFSKENMACYGANKNDW